MILLIILHILVAYNISTSFRKTGKSRQGRATQRQIEALVTYLEQQPHVASGKFTTLNSHVQLKGSWEDLATFLNSLGPNGKEKDVKSWKTVSIYNTGCSATGERKSKE